MRRLRQAILDDLTDHAWVQIGQADGTWVDIDPTFPGLLFGQRVSDTLETVDPSALPDEWRHSLSLVLKAEFTQGGQTRTKNLLSLKTEAPLLSATPIVMVHPAEGGWYYPDGGFGITLKRTFDLIGGVKTGGLPYRPELRIADQTFVGDFLMIEGWIRPAFFHPAPPIEFVREWVCLTLDGPAYQEERCQQIIDRRIVSPEAGETEGGLLPIEYDEKQAPQALAGFRVYSVLTGSLPDDLVIARIQQTQPSTLSDEPAPDPESLALEAMEYQIPDESQLGSALGAIAQSAFSQSLKLRAVWRNGQFWGSVTSPNIYSFRIVLAEDEAGSSWGARWLDIIRDETRIPSSGQLWTAAVARTAIESSVLGFISGIGESGTEELFSTPIHFRAAGIDGLNVIREQAELERVNVPNDWRQSLATRLERHIIVTPTESSNNLHSWIELDRETGESRDAVVAVDLWPSAAGQQATLEYQAKNRGKMRMATRYSQRFCRLVQCATSTFKLATAGVKVWGRASFKYAKDVYDSA